MFSSYLLGNYNPLQRLSYYVDWQLSGGQAWLFRLVSLLIHVLNVGLVYILLRVWMGREIVAVIGAGLFLILTVNVENVAWISERKTLLATFFGLASMILWLRGRSRSAWACFAVGLLAKTSIIVLPGLFVLFDLEQRKGFRWRAYAAFMIPAVALGVVHRG